MHNKIKQQLQQVIYFVERIIGKLYYNGTTIEQPQVHYTPEESIPEEENSPAHHHSVNISDLIPLGERERLRVLFLFQVASAWNSWQSVYEACLNDPAIDANIVLVERMYLDTRLNFLNNARNFLIENNIGFINDNAILLSSYKPHVIFIQFPYYDTLPEKYNIDGLKELGIRIAYIPYGIEIGGGATNLRYQFNMLVQQNAWRIFARSVRHKQMYAKYCMIGSGHVVTFGHPRTDLYTKSTSGDKTIIVDKINQKKVFLWTPHFTVEKGGWSTFLEYQASILSFFEKQKDIYLIVRPHPLLFVALRDKAGWVNENITTFKETIAIMENAHLDFTPDYMLSFNAAHVILADAGSFVLEFFATGKPVIFLNNEEGPGLNDDGDVINYLYTVNNQVALNIYLDMMRDGNDPAQANRLAAIPQYFEMPQKGVGESIKEYIKETIKNKDFLLNSAVVMDVDHLRAEKYWQQDIITYLTPETYYERQEKELAGLLKRIGKIESAIDIGCGDGRFTKQICEYSGFMKAIDISVTLVEQAKQTLEPFNADVAVESITEARSCHSYNLVSCLGVTSSIIDNYVFLRTLDLLVASCKINGYLLMQDTLSTAVEQRNSPNASNSDYDYIYRNIEDYKSCFLSRKCTLVEEIDLENMLEKSLVNKFFLFKVK